MRSDPRDFEFEPQAAALVVIDMQNDFVKPGGLGDLKGYDISRMPKTIASIKRVLDAVRAAGINVVYTRQGYRPDLSDFPFRGRGLGSKGDIGTEGPLGRVLIRGHRGHEIVDELKPLEGEVVIDKPGFGAFHATELDLILRNWGTRYIIVTGVTTEVCVGSTVREANDRGYECLVLEDCVASYVPEFHKVSLEIFKEQGGLFGRVATSENFIDAIRDIG